MQQAAREATAPMVLIVEDDDAVASFLARLLERDGYAATVVEDGLTAVELLESGAAPQAILVDLMLPGWRGDVVADCARAADPDVPLIVMSGAVHDPGLAHLPRRATFLAKPFSAEELREALVGALAGR